MNKVFIPIVFGLIFAISSCNENIDTNKSQQPKIDSTLNQQEQLLKDEIKVHKDSLLPKENLIQYYRDNNRLDLAIHTTDSLIKNDSLNSRLWHIKAVLLLENYDTINAITAFEKAISITPSPTDLINLGAVYAYQKNNKALSISDELIRLFNERYKKEALFIKGIYFSKLNNNDEAFRYFDACIGIDFSFMEAYREKAIVLMKLKKYYQAINLLTKAITLNNSFDDGYYYMGKCFESINDSSRSAEYYQKAIFYNPNNTEAAEALQFLEKGKE